MKTVKTSEATDAALDWLVAKAKGISNIDCLGVAYAPKLGEEHFTVPFRPSTDWAQGGPIIEREGIQLSGWGSRWEAKLYWSKAAQGGPKRYWNMTGPNPLIAAMRCFVASRHGDEVEVPDELA